MSEFPQTCGGGHDGTNAQDHPGKLRPRPIEKGKMTNPRRLQKWVDPRLYSGESKIHGRGLFSRAAVAPGEILMRWGGVVIANADYDPTRYRSTSTSSCDEMHRLTTPIDEPRGLDEFMNHSCDPNLWLEDAVTMSAR